MDVTMTTPTNDIDALPQNLEPCLKAYLENNLVPEVKKHTAQLLRGNRRGVIGMMSLTGKLFKPPPLLYKAGDGASLHGLGHGSHPWLPQGPLNEFVIKTLVELTGQVVTAVEFTTLPYQTGAKNAMIVFGFSQLRARALWEGYSQPVKGGEMGKVLAQKTKKFLNLFQTRTDLKILKRGKELVNGCYIKKAYVSKFNHLTVVTGLNGKTATIQTFKELQKIQAGEFVWPANKARKS